MPNTKKRTKTKSKGRKTRATMRKKTAKSAGSKSTKNSAKKRTAKARRSGLSKRTQARQQKWGAAPMVEETVIDIIDEPLPGVVRVTEIQEAHVRVPDTEDKK